MSVGQVRLEPSRSLILFSNNNNIIKHVFELSKKSVEYERRHISQLINLENGRNGWK